MFGLFGKFNEIPKRLKNAQERVRQLVIEVRSENGIVYVKINGLREILELKIDEEKAKELSYDQLSEIIKETINDATKTLHIQIQEIFEDELGDIADGIPGFDIKKMMPFN
ncbi:MAG: YbaB/EbfC family nucleoid-associated protein [Chlorobi bacterium]|nr:YbaB/EbfC family nucleoid-associated protein [Chlorobiota bacterium]